MSRPILFFLFSSLCFSTVLYAQTPISMAAPTSLELEKEKLDIERLKLENEKLKMELEKAKLQASTPSATVPTSTPSGEKPKDPTEKEVKGYQQDVSNKARDLSLAHKAEEDLLVIDFVNAEFWYMGVRYSLHDFYDIEEAKVKVAKHLDQRLANGTPRYRYTVHNAALLRYESRDRGIFEMIPPEKPGDFRIMTPEGITLDSEVGDLRNAYQGLYFKYEGVGETDGFKTIRYQHSQDLLAFGDKLEFLVTKQGKIHKVRYGALDER
ncbi:MAG TPA: hypothetical protein VHE12_02530 [bacterium]|nr:hypothetical protein [bacterium]